MPAPGLTVRLLPADSGACGRYRMREPHRVTFGTPGWDIKAGFNPHTDKDADVVVLQRPMHRQLIQRHIPQLQAAGIAVVVEIDDDFAALPAGNAAFYFTHPKRDPDVNFHWLRKACRLADLVTCTTPALARRYAAHGRHAVLPNYVPASYLDIDHAGDGHTVGWAGNIVYHPHDLAACGVGVAQAIAASGATFLAIGDDRTNTVLGIPPAQAKHQPFVPLDEYPHALARLDIGLVPLIDNGFNQAKSALKMLEYAACGALPIVSPTPDNQRLHDTYGLGVLATKPKHWQRAITTALRDHDARTAATTAARQAIRQHLTYEHHAHQWLTAWQQAWLNRHHTQNTSHATA